MEPGPRPWPGPDPYWRGRGEDRPGALIGRLWPEVWPGGEAGPGLIALRAALQEARRGLSQLDEWAAGQAARRKELGQSLARQRAAASQEVALAREACLEAGRRRQAQVGLADAARQEALDLRERARSLDAWMKDVRPHGLTRVRDGRGRLFTLEKLEEYDRSRLEAWAGARRKAEAARAALDAAGQARRDLERAEAGLREAQARQETIRGEIAANRDGFRRGARDRRELRLRRARALERVQSLERVQAGHREMVRLAAHWLRRDLAAAPRTEPPRDLLGQAGDLAAQAGRWGQRALRLSRLVKRQEAWLAALQDRAARLARRGSRLNREIKRIDKELPRLLGSLTDSQALDTEARARALSDLTALRARLEELRPQAADLADTYQDLILRQEAALDRAKLLTERWRDAGRTERQSLAQAQALLVEAEVTCRAMRAENQELELAMGQWVAACLALNPPELAAPAGRMARGLALRREAAREAAQECARYQSAVNNPLAGNLSKTPARLKPYGNTLRRQRERAVDGERLEGLWQVADYWHALLVGDLAEQIKAPLKEENRHLSQLVSDLDAERRELAERARDLDGMLERSRREHGQARETIMKLEKVAAQHEDLKYQAARLERDLSLTRQEHGQAREAIERLEKVAAQHEELKDQAARLERDLSVSRREHGAARDAVRRLEKVAQAHDSLQVEARRLESDLSATRREQSQALATIAELEGEAARAAIFEQKLDHSRQVSAALKQKLLERHGQLRRSEMERRDLEVWREKAQQEAKTLAATERRLAWTRRELDSLRLERIDALSEAGLLHDDRSVGQEAPERLAARRQAGRSLKDELVAARGEALRWSRLASDLSAALSLMGEQHRGQTKELTQEVYQLSHQATELKQELEQVRVLLMAALTFQADQMPKPEGLTLSQEQVEHLLRRLAAARRKLAELGRSTVGQWSLIAALTSGLVLGNPQPPSKATLLEASPRLSRPAISQTLPAGRGELLSGVGLEVAATGVPLPPMVSRAGLNLDLMPRRSARSEPPAEVAGEVTRLAAERGLGAEVLMPLARQACRGQGVLEVEALARTAEAARCLAAGHPVMFRDLERRGQAPRDLAPDYSPAAGAGSGGKYLDKLYTEYRTLGFSPQQALGAVAAAQAATGQLKEQWSPGRSYKGRVKPLAVIEEMDRQAFVTSMAPYIVDRADRFLRSRGEDFSGDLAGYARSLASDMHDAAKLFDLPVSILMAIAHQETWYTNVLGDQNRSASPFHIFNPTKLLIVDSMARAGLVAPPRGISLERHLTMATFMAAFHLRELMQDSWVAVSDGRDGYVDMNRVMKRYNGSSAYAGRVADRQREQLAYLKNTNKISHNDTGPLTPRISLPNL